MSKEYTVREARDILIHNGFERVRVSGGHGVYSNGVETVSIPLHGKNVNRMLFQRLIKQYNLVR